MNRDKARKDAVRLFRERKCLKEIRDYLLYVGYLKSSDGEDEGLEQVKALIVDATKIEFPWLEEAAILEQLNDFSK